MWSSAYDYEKYEQEGYKTPESFSRNKHRSSAAGTAQQQPTEANEGPVQPQRTSLPGNGPESYREPGQQSNHQDQHQEHIDMSNQVFGGRPSFYDGQRKPEPLDGRDKRFEQQSYISPRYEQQSYQSPRQEPEQQAR
ncbi:hypothetical protein MAR_027804, partial [Mya arenaria]